MPEATFGQMVDALYDVNGFDIAYWGPGALSFFAHLGAINRVYVQGPSKYISGGSWEQLGVGKSQKPW